MNQKKILFICVIIAAIAVVSGIIATASPRLNSSNFGQAVNEILKNTDDTGIVAVDGIEITKTDLNLLKNEYATTDPQKDISDKEIIDELIRKQVVLNEAENLGISVSYEEAEEEFYYNYNLIKDAVDNGDKYAEQALDAINQYRKARGM